MSIHFPNAATEKKKETFTKLRTRKQQERSKSKSIIQPYLNRILLPPIEVHVDEGDSGESKDSNNDENRIRTQRSSENAPRRLNKQAKLSAPWSRAKSIRRTEIVATAKELAANEAEARVGEGGRRIERKTWIEGK